MDKQITITIDTTDDSMVGGAGWGNYNQQDSIQAFEDMVLAAVLHEYPDYTITAHRGNLSKICVENEDGFAFDGDDVDDVHAIIQDVYAEMKWPVEDTGKIALIDQYKKLGREVAETEEHQSSEDAWEANESHYELTADEKEVAADAFGEGFIRYIPPELNDVLTAAEAGEVFGLAEATVRQAINRGQIFARKSGGTWLIRRNDANAKWGKSK